MKHVEINFRRDMFSSPNLFDAQAASLGHFSYNLLTQSTIQVFRIGKALWKKDGTDGPSLANNQNYYIS